MFSADILVVSRKNKLLNSLVFQNSLSRPNCRDLQCRHREARIELGLQLEFQTLSKYVQMTVKAVFVIQDDVFKNAYKWRLLHIRN